MFIQLLIGTFMIGATVILHALALDFFIRHAAVVENIISRRLRHRSWKPFMVATVVLALFITHVIEMWMWAILYFSLSAFPDLESALYFSTTAFTTVGFGDIVPVHQWRLLGAIEGANGFMLFGWSTAFTFEVMSQLYRKEGESIRHK